MKMRKFVILMVACSALSVQAQYVETVHRNEGHTERLLQEAKLLYTEHCYDKAGELLNQAERSSLTHAQQHEVAAMQALIAYHRNPQTAAKVIEDYLRHYPDAPELNRMKALALLSRYAQGDYAKVLMEMQEVV